MRSRPVDKIFGPEVDMSITDFDVEEVVYSPVVNKEITEKFNEVFDRLKELGSPAILGTPPQVGSPPPGTSWTRRNAPIISLCSIPLAGVAILVSFFNPRAIKNADKEDEAFGSRWIVILTPNPPAYERLSQRLSNLSLDWTGSWMASYPYRRA
jgi:hypothetical protein